MSLTSKLVRPTTRFHGIKPSRIMVTSPSMFQKFRFAQTMVNVQQSPLSQADKELVAVTQQHPSGICEIQMNRPKKLNAFNDEMCGIMSRSILEWEKSETAKAILVKGNGGKAFCAGGDIKFLLDLEDTNQHQVAADIFSRHCRLQHLIGSIKTPYIALMDGITMGAGVGLVMNAPFRVATENTLYSMPENMIGHFNDASATFWMPRLDGHMGEYLGVTSSRLGGADSFFAGIATHFVQSKNLNELEKALQDLAIKSNSRLDRDSINAVIEDFSENMDQDKFSLGGGIYQAINRCFQYGTMEEIINALEEEKEAVQWAKQTIEQLSALSPTAMKTSLELFRRGVDLSLLESLRLESKVASRSMAGREFSEGVRSVVVTRTKADWDPPTLKQVDLEDLKSRFFDAPDNNPMEPLLDGGHLKEYPQTRYMLPRCSEILEVANKINNQEDTIKYLVEKYNDKKGIKAKITSVLQ
ncbi:ClpP/crotonase-like domain-containing protein [Phascolomyces articulosus]|uniref:3-hydroxyisobutyryl-CoA hydrolase n=1 Tax=Phascolomyces articulosus TaxID=60185 RepID=A0AAD5JLW9_9FUNG|nr:ClpP/crotonase-like domain-containing protein [Phascolomyces articulosus]